VKHLRRIPRAATMPSAAAANALGIAVPVLANRGHTGTPVISTIRLTVLAAAPPGASRPEDIT